MRQDRSIKIWGAIRKAGKNNVLFLDMIRGLAVVNMVAYHLLYDLVYIFGVQVSWFSIRKSFVWEQFICFTFILVSGISFHLSRVPWKNGLKLLGCGMLLTVVTILVIPQEVILFGILHFLGFAILLTWVCSRWLRKIPDVVGISISFFLFLLTRHVPSGKMGLLQLWERNLPDAFYRNPFLFWAGFPDENFLSADYFPIIPWFFLFLVGYFGAKWWIKGSDAIKQKTSLFSTIGVLEYRCGSRAASQQKLNYSYDQRVTKRSIKKEPQVIGVYRICDQSLGVIGRYSLWIYMLHQPLIYGVLLLLL